MPSQLSSRRPQNDNHFPLLFFTTYSQYLHVTRKFAHFASTFCMRKNSCAIKISSKNIGAQQILNLKQIRQILDLHIFQNGTWNREIFDRGKVKINHLLQIKDEEENRDLFDSETNQLKEWLKWDINYRKWKPEFVIFVISQLQNLQEIENKTCFNG